MSSVRCSLLVLRDLDRLQDIEVTKGSRTTVLRTPVADVTGNLFKAVGGALPSNMRDAA